MSFVISWKKKKVVRNTSESLETKVSRKTANYTTADP